jgi:hypothetical protein
MSSTITVSLHPADRAPSRVAGQSTVAGALGALAWLAQPIWFLALGRVLARHATSAGGTEPIELAPPRRARGRALLRRLRRWVRRLHATRARARSHQVGRVQVGEVSRGGQVEAR